MFTHFNDSKIDQNDQDNKKQKKTNYSNWDKMVRRSQAAKNTQVNLNKNDNSPINKSDYSNWDEMVRRSQAAKNTQVNLNENENAPIKKTDYSKWDEMVRRSQPARNSQMENSEQKNIEKTNTSQMEKLDPESESLVLKIVGLLIGIDSAEGHPLELLKVLPPPLLIKPNNQSENPEYKNAEQKQSWLNEIKLSLENVVDSLLNPNVEAIAFADAQVKAIANAKVNEVTNHQNRCVELNQISNKDLANQYLMVAIASYDFHKLDFRPTLRGTMIHKIAADVALNDVAMAEKVCKGLKHPFKDGVEENFFMGFRMPKIIPGGVKPDLLDDKGNIYDHKLGKGSTEVSHNKRVTHLKGYVAEDVDTITSFDSKPDGVLERFRTKIRP